MAEATESTDAAVMLPPGLPAQLLRTDVIPDHQSRHCGSPIPPSPNHNICNANPLRCNSFGESASTQVGISRLAELLETENQSMTSGI